MHYHQYTNIVMGSELFVRQKIFYEMNQSSCVRV